MQILMVMRFHLTGLNGTIKKTNVNICWQGWRKEQHLFTVSAVVTGEDTVEISVQALQKN